MSNALDFHGLERPTPPRNDDAITPYAVCPSDVIPVCCTRIDADGDNRMVWAPWIDRRVSGHGRVVLEWQCMVCHTVLAIDDRRLRFYREQQQRAGRELCTRHATALVFFTTPSVAPVETCSVQHDPLEVPCIIDHFSDCVFYRDVPISICSSDSEPEAPIALPDAAAGGDDASPGPAGTDDPMCEEECEAGESEPVENDRISIDSHDSGSLLLPNSESDSD